MSKPKIHFIKAHQNAVLPAYETSEAAGADVRCVEDFGIAGGGQVIVSTGLKCAIEPGWEIQVRPRSGLAAKHGITVLNAPGTIDADYTGELKILLVKHSPGLLFFEAGDRIAQIVVAPVTQGEFAWAEEARQTERGEGGLGSTGVK